MLHLLMIALVLVLFLHDAPMVSALRVSGGGWSGAIMGLGGPLLLALLAQAWVMRCASKCEKTGSGLYVFRDDAGIMVTRVGIVLTHALSVLVLGWLDTLRSAMGGAYMLPELAALVAPTLAITAGWWSFYPLDRRMRQARLFASIEEGDTIYPERTRAGYVLDQFRHHAMLALTPLVMILAWHQALLLIATRAGWSLHEPGPAMAYSAVQIAGVGVVFLFTPPIMRYIWSTRRLGPGELRERLDVMCAAHKVRHRGVLVWRTHGTMMNGAVMGLIAPVRYILLTDALLDKMPDRQLEAVMAHEIAHVRRRHLLWLLGAMGAALLLAGGAVSLAALPVERLVGQPYDALVRLVADAAAFVLSILFALWVFGMVSRRFERQADAFAVQHFSGMTSDPESARGRTVEPEAVDAMVGALQTVADLNMIPTRKHFWRHGSIADRQRRLMRLVGLPVRPLPIDREVAVIKVATLVTLGVVLGIMAWRVIAELT
ncbi:MAG: hypothetical protein EA379_01725 [Phycisphaerales bacterium]|nr:MAG: hypothetical protein EA379_01725 [Phycisphaerales bacterium]